MNNIFSTSNNIDKKHIFVSFSPKEIRSKKYFSFITIKKAAIKRQMKKAKNQFLFRNYVRLFVSSLMIIQILMIFVLHIIFKEDRGLLLWIYSLLLFQHKVKICKIDLNDAWTIYLILKELIIVNLYLQEHVDVIIKVFVIHIQVHVFARQVFSVNNVNNYNVRLKTWLSMISYFFLYTLATTLCNNIVCKNSGVCNILSPTFSTCWCLLGNRKWCQDCLIDCFIYERFSWWILWTTTRLDKIL